MELSILNHNIEQTYILDDYESLVWVDRYSECGEFEIYMAVNPEIIALLISESQAYLYTKDSDHSMLMDEYEIQTTSDDGNKLVLKGKSLEYILNRRIVWTPFKFKGHIQDGVKRLLDENVISPSIPGRKIKRLRFKQSNDPRLAKIDIDWNLGIGESIYDVIATTCKDKKVGFSITIADDDMFDFQLYLGTDHSYSQLTNPYVVFSPDFDNMADSNYLYSRNEAKNVILMVSGQTESGNPELTEIIDPGSKTDIDRWEAASNSTQFSSNDISESEKRAEMQKKGKEELKDLIPVSSFEGQIEASNMFVYGQDFKLGDLVQVKNQYGITSRSRISEVVRSQDSDDYEMYPTFVEEKEDKK